MGYARFAPARRRPYSGDEVRDVDVDRVQRPPLEPVELLQRGEAEGEGEGEGERVRVRVRVRVRNEE